MITMDNIVREGHPSLRTKAKAVKLPPSKDDIKLLNDMLTFLKNSQDEEIAKKYNLRSGVGLAAPQLGIEKQLIAIHFIDEDEQEHTYQLINPKIISHSVQQSYLQGGEGCLSVDRPVEGYVHRHARITIKAYNIDGEKGTLKLRGYSPIVFQHEIDHLNGITSFDHINENNHFFIPENSKPI